ncbi:GEVED domain-containing protein [Flavobacterium sp.]|jgi:hypothetical protein|uniref:GEVED domain-containing protein n=1 Tax=Flavobacterium sp. TaxID=239 RepID=UPI0037BEBB67
MNRNLLPKISTLFTSPFSKSFGSLLTLVLVLNFGITSKINAQCIGPYQVFESIRTKGAIGTPNTMVNDGWTIPASAVVSTGSPSNSRSGGALLQIPSTSGYFQTPLISNPKDFSFYVRTLNTTFTDVYKVEWSNDVNFATIIGTSGNLTISSTTYQNYSVNLSLLINIYVRVTYISNYNTATLVPGAANANVLRFDDFSWTSTVASQNTIVVPELGNTTCSSVIVPAAGAGVLKFYDQGGLSDNYNSPRTYTSAATATSVGTTVTVSTTANLVVGMYLTVQSGTGAFAPGTTVISIIDATNFTVSSAPTTALSSAIVFGTLVTTPFISGGASSAGTTITVATTTNLVVGMSIAMVSGTGVFAVGTTVTSILNGTSFTVSVAPTTQLSGAVVRGTPPQTQIVVFQPTNALEKVRLTFVNSFALDALANITVYNANGVVVGSEFVNANAYTSTATLPGAAQTPQYAFTSTAPGGYVTVKFVSSILPPLSGFDVNVECVADLSITSLSASSGCLGSPFTVTGTGFTNTAMSATVGGFAATATYVNPTTITITPTTAVASGAVVLTNGGTATSPTNYTVIALPIVSAGPSVCVGSTITISPVTGGTWSSSDLTKATVTNAGIVTGIAAGSATFTFTNSTTGCGATTSAVTVNALPVVSAGPTVCVGGTITLSPTTGGTWSSSNNSKATVTNAGVVTGVSTGSVNFSFTNSTTGCNAVTSLVDIIDAPVVNLNTAVAQTYCQNATASALSVTASTVSGVITSYQWFSNTASSTSGATTIGGATTNSYTPLTTTSGTLYYFCQATNTAGCVTNSAVSGAILINGPLSPTTTTAATGPSFSSFVANWTALVGATGYYLDVSTSNTFATFLPGYNNLLVGNVSSYLVSGLVINTPYYYRVRAINSCATSTNSNTTTVTTGFISYCFPIYATGSGAGDQITNVTLGALNNTSGASTAPFYTFYNSVTIPTLYQNSTSTISISFGTQSRQYVGVWIDYNQNSLFEASEGVVSINNAGSNGTSVLTLTIPAGAITGNTRMRVRGGDNAVLTTGMACGATSSVFGETEDYIVTILSIPPCAVVLPTGLASSFVTGTSATISWSDASNTLGSIYEYAFSTSSVTPTSGTLLTSATSTNLTGLTAGVTYYAWVRTNCGGSNQSAWVGPISFFTGVLDVVNLNATTNGGSLTTCFAKFYDSGGPTAPYANNETYTYTFVPTTAGSKLKAVFNSFALENNYDFLSIYNGTTATAANLVGTYTNAQIVAGQTFFSTAPGGELTFRFTSDFSVTPAGWDVSLSCVTVPTITSFTPTSACAGVATVVTITGTNMTAVNSVSFNGITAVPTATTATSVTVNLPATATSGLVSVSTATASGNSALATVPVFTVNPRPSTPNAGADANICTGGPLTLNATGVISPQPIYQNNFSSGAGLVTSHTNWSAVSTNLAGGAASGELRFFWFPSSTDDFWIYPNQLINTTGYTALNLTFNSAVDWYTGTFDLYVDTSPTGAPGTWTSRWNVAPTGNIAAGPVSVNLGALDGTSFYIRYRLSGYTFNIDNWYIDDMLVTGIPPLNYSWNTNSSLSSTSIANPIATPATTQTYTVTTSFNGCSSPTDSVLVTVSPKPTSVISGSQSICNGATANVSVALTGVGPWNLTYTNGSTPTTVTGILTSPYTFTTPAISASTTYTISALSDSRCSSGPADRTGSAVISLITPPTVTIAASAASVCFNFASQTTTLAYSATTGSPATYSIIWGAGYSPSGFVTMTDAPFPAGASGTINITVPPGASNLVVNTATIVVKNAQGCISASYSFSLAVNISPAVTMTVSSQTRCFSASSQTVTYTYSGANVANNYDVTWNASPANSLQTFSNIPFPSITGSITINVPAGTPGGTYTGTVTPRNSGCGIGAAPRTITLIISQPSITPAASATLACFSATAQTTTLAYSNPVATPTLYSIVWNSVPANSFVGVTDASITASLLTISIPANTAANTYTGTISVKNANACVSPGTTFTVSVIDKPVMSGINIQSLCFSASIQNPLLTFSSVTNSPTSYSIDWNPAANAAGFADQGVTTDAFDSTGITTVAIPANLPLNKYTGTLTIFNSACSNSYPLDFYLGKVWNGVTSSNWATSSNWTPSGAPLITDSCVVVPAGTPNSPVISVQAFSGALTINSGALLTVNTGITLTVQDVIVTNGTLSVADDASLIQVNNVANSGSGNMQYSRNVSGLRGFDYIYWSSPVLNQPISGLYTSPDPGFRYYWDTLINNGNGGQGNWVAATGAMEVGKGYIMRASSSFGWTGDLTATFTGRPNNGTIPVTVKRGIYDGAAGYNGVNGSLITKDDDNYNLIGNPYPSAIDAGVFLTQNTNIQGFVKLWTHGQAPTSSTNPFYGSFALNYEDDYVTYNGSGSSPPGFLGKIASGQGFFVVMNDGGQVTGNTEQVVFRNTMRNANNSQFYRTSSLSSNTEEKNRIWLDLVDANTNATSTLVAYVQNATNGVDRMYDAITKVDSHNLIYSTIENQKYIIQGRSFPFDVNDLVSIGYNATSSGVYKIAIAAVDGLFEQGQPIFLEDKLLDIIHDLRAAPYSFSSAAGIFNDRFVLRYTAGALGVPVFTENTVLVYKNETGITINTGTIPMKSVAIYDVTGRLITSQKEIYTTQTSFTTLPSTNQVLLVKITSETGVKVTKKVVY